MVVGLTSHQNNVSRVQRLLCHTKCGWLHPQPSRASLFHFNLIPVYFNLCTDTYKQVSYREGGMVRECQLTSPYSSIVQKRKSRDSKAKGLLNKCFLTCI
jgi:hypothetical protein